MAESVHSEKEIFGNKLLSELPICLTIWEENGGKNKQISTRTVGMLGHR